MASNTQAREKIMREMLEKERAMMKVRNSGFNKGRKSRSSSSGKLNSPIPHENRNHRDESDWLELEGEEELRYRLQMFNIRELDRSQKLKALLKDVIWEPGENFGTLKKNAIGVGSYKPKPELALEYYKTVMKGGDYEFVELINEIPTSLLWFHINFTARLKGSGDSDPQLFFAELKRGRPMTVTHCCKLYRSPYPAGKTHPPDTPMLHCDCVKCLRCDKRIEELKRPGDWVFM